MIQHLFLVDEGCEKLVAYAKTRATQLYASLAHAGRRQGVKRIEITDNRVVYYLDIRVFAPNVWIYISSKQCPTVTSGLVFIQDYFHPTLTVNNVAALHSFFFKAHPLVVAEAPPLAATAETLKVTRSTLYSGEMRQVVQMLLGAGLPIPYAYGSDKTHGVFVAKNKSRWILRVSSNGVVAYPMQLCVGSNTPKKLGYTPIPTTEPAHEKEVIRLLTADQIKEAFNDKAAFFASCGWAFSQTGHKLANCFTAYKDNRGYAYQYEITVAEDPQTGVPATATMALKNEGYVHGPKTTHMKYPVGDNSAVTSFDVFGGNTNFSKDSFGPVFCYYANEDLQTFFFVYAPKQSSVKAIDSYDAANHPGISATCTEFEGVTTYQGFVTQSAVPRIVLNKKTPMFKTSKQLNTYFWQHREDQSSIFIPEQSVGDVVIGVNLVPTDFDITTAGSPTVEGDIVDVLCVPQWEREAAYVISHDVSVRGGYTHRVEAGAWERYTMTGKCLEFCQVIANVHCIQYEWASILNYSFFDAACSSGLRAANNLGVPSIRGVGVGSTVREKDQTTTGPNGRCLSSLGLELIRYATSPNFLVSSNTIPSFSVSTYELFLYLSPTHKVGIPLPSDGVAEAWLKFTDQGFAQSVIVTRDAFNADRWSAVKAPDWTRGDLCHAPNYGPYSLANVTSSHFHFVGNP